MCGRTAVPVRRAVFSSSSMSAGEGHSASFFSFVPSCLLPAFSCPYHPVVSYRLRPVEALRGGGVVALGDTPRRVGGVIWLLVSRPVPSSRSAARSISPYRLAGRMRAPFLSAHSPASFVGGWSYRFPFRLVPRLVCPSRGASRIYSLRFACRLVLLVNSPASYCPVSPGGSSLSLPVLFIVPWCLVFAFHLAGVSLFRLARSSRQAVRVLSFRPGVSSRRLVGRVVSSLSCSLLFSDHSFAASHGHGNGRRLVICGLVSLVSLRRATSWNPIG